MGRWRACTASRAMSSPSRFRSRGLPTPTTHSRPTNSPTYRVCSILGSVQMVGCAKMVNGKFERTLFTSGFSAPRPTKFMNTYDDPAIRSHAMADFDMTRAITARQFFHLRILG